MTWNFGKRVHIPSCSVQAQIGSSLHTASAAAPSLCAGLLLVVSAVSNPCTSVMPQSRVQLAPASVINPSAGQRLTGRLRQRQRLQSQCSAC
jgi:hypothetical protein